MRDIYPKKTLHSINVWFSISPKLPTVSGNEALLRSFFYDQCGYSSLQICSKYVFLLHISSSLCDLLLCSWISWTSNYQSHALFNESLSSLLCVMKYSLIVCWFLLNLSFYGIPFLLGLIVGFIFLFSLLKFFGNCLNALNCLFEFFEEVIVKIILFVVFFAFAPSILFVYTYLGFPIELRISSLSYSLYICVAIVRTNWEGGIGFWNLFRIFLFLVFPTWRA